MKLKDPRLEALVDTAQTFTHNDLKEITLAYQCAGRSGIEIVISIDSLLNKNLHFKNHLHKLIALGNIHSS